MFSRSTNQKRVIIIRVMGNYLVFSFKLIDMDCLNPKIIGLLSHLGLLLSRFDNLSREKVIQEKIKNSKKYL